MIELEKAKSLTGRALIRTETETVPLEHSLGRILAEGVHADLDVPAFSRATMDGYACRREDLPGPLEVLETIPAGKVPVLDLGSGQCSRIMTGAMLPEGADCVIMQEFVKNSRNGKIRFTGKETDSNVHSRGQDLKKGDLILDRGIRITPAHIGMIASAGRIRITVLAPIRIGILATGSELIEPGQIPHGAQIRNSNSHQLAAQTVRAGHHPEYLGYVEDQKEQLAGRIREALKRTDMLLLTGGASVGELDLVPGVLQELGFRLEFDAVAMQPGKPVCFGHRDGQVCFGLSGNPVSSFVQFELLVRPYLAQCTGEIQVNRRIRIRIEQGYRRRKADRPFFLPVCFTEMGTCEPVTYHGSGHLHALADATGFAEIPAKQTTVRKGEFVHVRLI